MDEELKNFLQEFQMEVDLCRAKYSSTGKDTYLEVLQNGITKLEALIASYSREARIDELEHLFDKNYITGIDLQPETITTRLKALGGKPEGKPNE